MTTLLSRAGATYALAPGLFLLGNDCAASGVYRHFLGRSYPHPFVDAYMPALQFIHLANNFNSVDWHGLDYTPTPITDSTVVLKYGIRVQPAACYELRLRFGCMDAGFLFPHVDSCDDTFPDKVKRRADRFKNLLVSKRPVFCLDLHDWEVAMGVSPDYCSKVFDGRNDAVFLYRPALPKTDIEHGRGMLNALVEKGLAYNLD